MTDKIIDFASLAGTLFGALWAYVQFVAKPSILAEVDKRFVSREMYQLQNDFILKDLAEIKAEIKELKAALREDKK